MTEPSGEVDVKVTAPVYPTEHSERVEEAVLNLFPEAEARVEDPAVEALTDRLVAMDAELTRLRELFERFEIEETAREELRGSVVGDVVEFTLKKQAAYAGRPSFDVGGHELGALHVRVESSHPIETVEWLTEVER